MYIKVRIVTDVATNGLPTQGKFIKCEEGAFHILRSVKMYTKFCLLLCLFTPF